MSEAGTAPVIFLHVPKTAGLTLRHLIRRQYAHRDIFVPRIKRETSRQPYIRWIREGGEPPKPLEGGRNAVYEKQLAAMGPERLGELRLLMGHFWFGLHEFLPEPASYLSLLRDPVNRVLSLYHHRATRHDLRMSLEDYVRAGRDYMMDNGQTRRFANRTGQDRLAEPATADLLEEAQRNLDASFSVVGLTERFDESLLLMGPAFGWRHLTYLSWNVASDRPRAETLDREVVRGIEARTELDRELYDWAARRFQAALEQRLDDPVRELAAFRRRNTRYQRFAPVLRAGRRRLGRVARVVRPARTPA